ncbi:MAG: zinc ribbon domain-containing protein [Chthonomonadales bacterium]
MKCARCGAEVPSGALFCMKCGAPTSLPASQPRRRFPTVALAAILALLLAAAIAGYRALNPTNRLGSATPPGQLLEKTGSAGMGGPLLDRSGRVAQGGPVTGQTATAPPPPPADVVDYLKFLKDVEKRRLLLERQQIAELLKQSANLTYPGATADWTTNEPERQAQRTYSEFQASLAQWSGQWQALSRYFLSKQPPQSCTTLRDKYYDLLGKTAGSLASVGNSFNKAMSGDPGAALDALTRQQGSGMGTPSREVRDACSAADDELDRVCREFGIPKDFSIQDDTGGANLLGR